MAITIQCPRCKHTQTLRSRTIAKLKARGRKTVWCSKCKLKFKLVVS